MAAADLYTDDYGERIPSALRAADEKETSRAKERNVMTMANENAFVLHEDCSYCGAQEKEEQQELLYECSNCDNDQGYDEPKFIFLHIPMHLYSVFNCSRVLNANSI